jgi:phosphopantetheine adenylyltransferase/dephospho-CoA kinase
LIQKGHKAYEKNSKGYQSVIENFGNDILDDDGNIDRKKLGKLVFGKPSELRKLNEIVWPEIKNLTNNEINRLFNIEGKKIIVIEAAVLFEAKWDDIMNEIWVCFIPDEEVFEISNIKINGNFLKIFFI